MKTWLVGLAVLAMGTLAAQAQVVWEDTFDDGQAQMPWFTTTPGVASWSLADTPGKVTINQLTGSVNNEWCEVVFTRSLGCLDDFLITVNLGWQEADNSAMQGVYAEVGGASGPIALGGFDDAWVGARGQWTSHVDEQWWGIGYNTMAFTDSTEVKLVREDGLCRVIMYTMQLNQGIFNDAATWFKLRFRRFQYATSTFGNLWTDFVRVEAPFRTELAPLADGSLHFTWGECTVSPIRLYGAPAWPAQWPEDFQLLAQVPAGQNQWTLPAPVGSDLSVFRATRVLD
jgi:hypothetical protein